MQTHNGRVKIVILAIVSLFSLPTAAQQTKQGTVSDDDLIKLNQQIRELKNPTFRAFLRMQLLSWEAPTSGQMRRQAAMEVATQGVTDLCEHQDEVWSPTASWLYAGFVRQIKSLQEETAVQICALKTDAKNDPARNFSSAIKMLSNPETSAAGLDLAKAAVLSGEIPATVILGQLLSFNAHSPHLPELLNAVLTLEEKQPGKLPLQLMPFFSPLFLEKSVPTDIVKRFLFVAVRATRVSTEALTNPSVRSPVRTLLNAIVMPAQRLAPELYTEIVSRLSSLNPTSPNLTETRLAAEERIQKASDHLEQLISEANSASDEELKMSFFFRAARLAKEQDQLTKAVDLAMKTANGSNSSTWLNGFLSDVVTAAVKKKSPRDATYAISKMTQPLEKARAFHLLGEYYGDNHDNVKGREALTHSAKQLESVDDNVEKVRTSLSVAESVLKYEPADAYEVFRESVKAVNALPAPEKDQEKTYYVRLMPIAEDLIRSFRLLAARENQTAITLASEIKLAELRVAALSGAYSSR